MISLKPANLRAILRASPVTGSPPMRPPVPDRAFLRTGFDAPVTGSARRWAAGFDMSPIREPMELKESPPMRPTMPDRAYPNTWTGLGGALLQAGVPADLLPPVLGAAGAPRDYHPYDRPNNSTTNSQACAPLWYVVSFHFIPFHCTHPPCTTCCHSPGGGRCPHWHRRRGGDGDAPPGHEYHRQGSESGRERSEGCREAERA